jgi:hypothetical protein
MDALTLIVLLLALAALIFWAWMLNDCISYEPYGAAKAIWIITIVFTGWFGAGVYFLFWRPERRKRLAIPIDRNNCDSESEGEEGDTLLNAE